jgi:hypothetical protein
MRAAIRTVLNTGKGRAGALINRGGSLVLTNRAGALILTRKAV